MTAIINVESSPSITQANPVENCVEYCFSFEDIITDIGSPAIYILRVNDNEPNVEGEIFTFKNIIFKVSTDNDNNYGGHLVDWTSNLASENGFAIQQAIAKHPLLNNKVTVSLTNLAGQSVVTVIWNAPGDRDWETLNV